MSNGETLTETSGGLSEKIARARLAAQGFNELPASRGRSIFKVFIDVLREPMLVMLIGAGAIYLFLGDAKEAAILLAFALLSLAITTIQEGRSERVLERLRDLSSPRATVIRDGKRRRIAGRELVVGDWIILAEGERVPADAVLLRAQDVEIDESLLTGESLPVRKRAAENASLIPSRPGGNDLPFVYSGSFVVRGSGLAQVTATGEQTEIGSIGRALTRLVPEPQPLQRQIAKLVRYCAAGGIVVSLCAVLLYGSFRGGWLDASLVGISIALAFLAAQ